MPEAANTTTHSKIQVANELASAGAISALRYFRNELDIEIKGDESPVTLADKQIEQEARDLLQKRFPDHEILGEEFGAGDLNADHVWVIDPIDGTRSFICGNPLFGYLLALMEGGAPVIGLISMPALDEVYMGQQGAGATLNGKPIKVSSTTKLSDAFIYINEGEKLLELETAALQNLVTAGHTRRFGYDCYPHALLAAGHVDAVVEFDLEPFDYLPLAGVIEAAGGGISDWDGNPLGFNSDGRVVSAATPQLHAELLEQLAGGRAQ